MAKTQIIGMSTSLLLASTVGLAFSYVNGYLSQLSSMTDVTSGWVRLGCIALLALLALKKRLRLPLRFAWNCFFKPFISKEKEDQQDRLNEFYSGQADVYDSTRTALLEGREAMLQLLAAHFKAQKGGVTQPRIWVDIGGGTGWNIEKMDDYLPVSTFDAIYLVDLCEPLLDIARNRFIRKGWKNVHVICDDASRFTLPEWTSGAMDPRGSLSLITLSYSLSMIPSYLPLLDRCDQVLNPDHGLIGVVDFYASRDCTVNSMAIGTANKRMSWFAKWFWECWFDLDNIHLNSARRDYLEYKMGTVKIYNGRNNFLNSYFVQIPYYIFLGCSRLRNVAQTTRTFEEQAGNCVGQGVGGLMTPISPFGKADGARGLERPSAFTLDAPLQPQDMEQTLRDVGAPKSPFHYQLRKSWRLPYLETQVHKQFRTHIYGWTWEDPEVDVQKLGINADDNILAITSAGDNVLHYAIASNVHTVHAVDMNPCQGHILELKLAASQSLAYEDFWKIFGEGHHDDFGKLLATRMAPFLSSHAFAYWSANAWQFKRNFYFRGYSGWALRLARVAFFLAGVRKDVERLVTASTVAEQESIYQRRLRPILMNSFMVRILGSPFFNWHALGVPFNQLSMFMSDGSVQDFIAATFDPIPGLTTLKNGNYHYLLCLRGRYTRAACPKYLKPEGFATLKSRSTTRFHLHTDTILNALRGMSSNSLTKVIVMDSLDWFDPIPPSTPLPPVHNVLENRVVSPEEEYEHLKSELDYEVMEMHRVLQAGGYAVWRSAAKYPWYRQRFELAGFKVEPIDIRQDGKAIDRVNMYASFWRAQKVAVHQA